MSSSPTPQPSLPHSQYARFEGMRGYEAMFDELIPKTVRVIRIFDKSLYPSYNAARCTLLRQFLRADPANRLHVVLHEVRGFERLCPHFVTLLQQFPDFAG